MRRLAVAVVLALAWTAPAAARPIAAAPCVTYTPQGSSDDWNAPANWSTGAVPTANDDVCLPAASSVTIRAAAPPIRSLSAPDASLDVEANLNVGAGGAAVGFLKIGAGTLSAAAPVTADNLALSGGSLGGAGSATIGHLHWSAGTLAGPGAVTVTGGGALSGTLELGTALAGAGPLTLANALLEGAGTLSTTAALDATAAQIAVPFAAGGAVNVDGGVLTLTGGGSGAGPYTVAQGATLDWHGGSYALNAPAATGATRISGATVTTTGSAGLGALALTGGTLTVAPTLAGPGTLALSKLAWSGGTLAGSGRTTAGALTVAAPGGTLADGTLAVTGASSLSAPLALAGRLENGGVMDVQGGSDITGIGLLVNTGTIRNRAGGVTVLGTPLDNDGVLDAEAGTLRLTGGSGTGNVSTGSYVAAAGATIDWRAGAYSLASPTESGAGTALVSGAALSVSGAARFGTLVLSAGGADFADPLTADTVSLGAATLSGGEAMNIGHLAWSAGTLSTRDALGHDGTTTVGTLTLTGAVTKTLRHRTLALGGSSAVDGSLTLDSAEIDNAGVLDFQGDTSLTGTGALKNAAAGTLRNDTATTTVALPVTNQGTVDVARGTLQLASLNDGTLGPGTYALAGTLLVPDLAVATNAATLRLAAGGGLSNAAGDALAHLAANTGTLELDGRNLALAGGLANSGTVRLSGATLTTAGPYVQSAGLTTLDGGTLRAAAPVQLAGGRLTGTGTIAPGLVNAATVAPGAPLTVAGDYAQTAAGALAAPPGRLAVTGAASLAGTLAVDPAAVPLSDGATFPLLTAGAVTGQWAAPPAASGYSFAVGYGATSATLTASKVSDHKDDGGDHVADVPQPQPGRTAVVASVTGTVLVKQPGASGFTPLKGTPGTSLPVGAVVDARGGTVTFTTASSFPDAAKTPATQLSVAAALFQVKQEHSGDGHTEVTDLVVQTPQRSLHACLPRKGVPRPPHNKTVNLIRAKVAKGVVRTRGQAAMFTTRNASFSMRDRCDGTSTRVVHGRGTLFDRVTGRRHGLRARQSYIARTRLFAVRIARLHRLPKP